MLTGSSASSSNQGSVVPLATMMDLILSGAWRVDTVLQPIIDLQRGTTTGYEALARFPKETGMSPDRVLRAAEQLGCREALELLLVRGALSLREQLPENCFLSINVSPTFMLSEAWGKAVYDTGGLDRVVIEITEEHVIEDYSAIRREIHSVRQIGGTIAIDDTGAGYASLKHIMELRPDFIKLDRLFVNGCHLDPAKRQMIELLGDTADRLDSWVVAEGIETEGELREIVRLGIPLGQGYFLGRPSPQMNALTPECVALLRSQKKVALAGASLAQYAEACETATSLTLAHGLLLKEEAFSVIVVLDNWSRPVDMVERHALVGLRSLQGLTRVQASSTASEVLTRMLNRSASERFDPVAVVDERGLFQGILRVERLAEVVMQEASLHSLPSASVSAA
ncbi:MAG: EAL domain-containing protein [Acidobacteriaceae bacterium]|nr:EAL domain-containing protein [Acidobacteriaceae bacterium]